MQICTVWNTCLHFLWALSLLKVVMLRTLKWISVYLYKHLFNSISNSYVIDGTDIMKWAASWENRVFAYAKTKTQISFAVTAKLISAFVFATRIVQFLFYLNPKFQVSSHLLWLYSPVCVGPGRKPRRPVFSQRGANMCAKIWAVTL